MLKSITAFNQAMQKADEWLKDLKILGEFENEEQAYSALRAVLHALRNRLIPDEAIHLGSELPMLIRGVYFEGFDLKNPSRNDDLEEFLQGVAREMRNATFTIPPEKAARAVFSLLSNKISQGEMQDVLNMLPARLRSVLLTTA